MLNNDSSVYSKFCALSGILEEELNRRKEHYENYELLFFQSIGTHTADHLEKSILSTTNLAVLNVKEQTFRGKNGKNFRLNTSKKICINK